jgi:hypothetical protein
MASEALSRPSVGGGAAKFRDRMMDGKLSIGRFGGVEVRLHWSLLAVFALIVWSLADGVFPSQNPGLSDGTYLAMGVVAALLFLASIGQVPLLTEDETAVDALAVLSAPGANRGLVVDDGHLAGLLSISDLARALEVGRRPPKAQGDRG